jgi:hypothetical protein
VPFELYYFRGGATLLVRGGRTEVRGMACYYYSYVLLLLLEYLLHTGKYVNTRTNTQPGIRGAHRLAGTTGGHTTQNYNRSSKCIEKPTGLRFSWDLMTPGHHARVRAPHTPAVYPIGIYRAASYSAADGRLIRQYTCSSYICITHEPHSSPFLKPTEAP